MTWSARNITKLAVEVTDLRERHAAAAERDKAIADSLKRIEAAVSAQAAKFEQLKDRVCNGAVAQARQEAGTAVQRPRKQGL